MKKVFLLCAIAAIAVVAPAQNVTLAQLLKQPELTTANIFTSSFDEIVKEWNVKQNETLSDGSVKKSVAETYTYANCQFSSISFAENGETRDLKFFFLFDENSQVSQDDVLKHLTDDLKQLGFGKIKLKNGLYRQKENLPAPYTFIMIGNTSGMLFLSLKFNKGQTPDF